MTFPRVPAVWTRPPGTAQEDTSQGGGPPQAFPVTNASQIVVRDNQGRKKVTFFNDSAVRMYLAKSDLALINAGIPLQPGGMLIDQPDNRGYIYTGPWTAVSTVAGPSALAISEDR